jgi:hypothetical protein
MAVCCQNLPLGALGSNSAPSMLVGALFKKFDLFFLTRLVYSTTPKPLQGPQIYTEDRQYSPSTTTSSSSGHYEIEILFLMSKLTELHNYGFCRSVNRVLHRPTTAIPASVITFIIVRSSPENYDQFLNRGKKKSHLRR